MTKEKNKIRVFKIFFLVIIVVISFLCLALHNNLVSRRIWLSADGTAQPILSVYQNKEYLLSVSKAGKPEEHASQFLNYAVKKSNNTIRIGIIGDSFSYGSEAGFDYDFGSILQKKYREIGTSNVEVLNFSSGGWGFSEVFITWKSYARNYDLDFIILGPQGFQADRDTTFSKWGSWHIKGRHILKDEKVKYVRIKGETKKEQFYNFHSLIPSITQLRYDRAYPPAWLRYFKFLSKKQNIFYYSNVSAIEEAQQINTILLKKIFAVSPKTEIIFASKNTRKVNLYKALEPDLTMVHPFPYVHYPPYWAKGHQSAMGNELSANMLFNILNGVNGINIETIELKPNTISPIGNKEIEEKFVDIHQVTSGSLSCGSNKIARLTSLRNEKLKFPPKAKSVLYIIDEEGNPASGIMIPFSRKIKSGEKLYINRENPEINYIVGDVIHVGLGGAFAIAKTKAFEILDYKIYGKKSLRLRKKFLEKNKFKIDDGKKVTLAMGSSPITQSIKLKLEGKFPLYKAFPYQYGSSHWEGPDNSIYSLSKTTLKTCVPKVSFEVGGQVKTISLRMYSLHLRNTKINWDLPSRKNKIKIQPNGPAKLEKIN